MHTVLIVPPRGKRSGEFRNFVWESGVMSLEHPSPHSPPTPEKLEA